MIMNCWVRLCAKATGGGAKSGKQNLEKHLKMYLKKKQKNPAISQLSSAQLVSSGRGESDGVRQGSVLGPLLFSPTHFSDV